MRNITVERNMEKIFGSEIIFVKKKKLLKAGQVCMGP